MSDAVESRSHRVGEALFAELLWIHDALRRDLATVTTLADAVADGLPPASVRGEITTLATNTPLWQLKANCLSYCRFVHGHHRLEDVALFPTLRRTNPSLAADADGLEEDHRAVASLLREVEDATDALAADDTADTRQRVAQALRALSEHLLAHLEREERIVGPAMRSWERAPW